MATTISMINFPLATTDVLPRLELKQNEDHLLSSLRALKSAKGDDLH